MDGLPGETPEVLRDLIAKSEPHRQEQIGQLHALAARGESTDEAVQVLGRIANTPATMRAREAYLRALQSGQ